MIRQTILPLALLAAAALGCSKPLPMLPSAPERPAEEVITVDFGPVFAAEPASHTVLPSKREADLMRRILLGPNLVFEASRASVPEPKTVGPASPPPWTPNQEDALGTPIDIRLSSLLMRYLWQKGSTLLAPAVTRRWSAEWWCTKDNCPQTTWVERLLLLHQRPAGAGKESAATDGAPGELPTAALAVRILGRDAYTVDAVAEQAGKALVFRPRKTSFDASACPTTNISVPVVRFSAEVLSMRDGQVLARIDETRRISTPSEVRRQVKAVEHSKNPVAEQMRREYEEARRRGFEDWPRPSAPDWLSKDVRCANAAATAAELTRQIIEQSDADLDQALNEMVAKALNPLYEGLKATAPTPTPPPEKPAEPAKPPKPGFKTPKK
jgi:hypothetical protein